MKVTLVGASEMLMHYGPQACRGTLVGNAEMCSKNMQLFLEKLHILKLHLTNFRFNKKMRLFF